MKEELPKEVQDYIYHLQSRLESLEKVKVYKIGEATNRLVFQANGIENVSDMQRVFDAVEVVLESLEKDAARYRWLRLGSSSNRVPHITQWPAQRGEDYAQISIVGIDAAIDTAMQANKGE